MLNASDYIQYRFWSEGTSNICDFTIEYNRKIWATSGPSDESQICALGEGKDFGQQGYYLLASYMTHLSYKML